MRDDHHERRRTNLTALLAEAVKAWHGVKLDQPDWDDDSHCVALAGELTREGLRFYLILNQFWQPLDFELPAADAAQSFWRRWIDTGFDSPCDICPWQSAPPVSGSVYRARKIGRSSCC